ncbi:Secreted protein, partial [Globisporangium splendens]
METTTGATTSSSRRAVRRYYLELNARTIAMVLVAGIAALLGYLSPTHEDMNPHATHASLFPATLLAQSPLGDQLLRYAYNDTGGGGLEYAFGRWKTPVRNVTFHSDDADKWQTLKTNVFMTKWWHYSSFNTEEYFIGMAIVKLGYANDAFVYVVDKTASIAEKFEYTGNDSMRPAYVHKAAGSPVRGSFSFGNVSVDVSEVASSPALGAIDWTRSLALRCTRWNWASTSFFGRAVTTTAVVDASGVASTRTTEQVARIGINLSKDVYDIDGESQENAIWINGKVFPLRGVGFSIPADPVREQWRIQSVDGLYVESSAGVEHQLRTHEAVNLTFTPRGSREDHTKLVVMESDFIQPYGTFSGHIRIMSEEQSVIMDVQVDNAFGVVEQHFALCLVATTKKASSTWVDEHYLLVPENTAMWNIVLHAVCGTTKPRLACAVGKLMATTNTTANTTTNTTANTTTNTTTTPSPMPSATASASSTYAFNGFVVATLPALVVSAMM